MWVSRDRYLHDDVEVAVTEVAEHEQAVLRPDLDDERIGDALHDAFHRLQGQGDVEADRKAAVQHLLDVVAQRPERLNVGLALRHGGIDDQALLQGHLERGAEAAAVERVIATLCLDEHIERVVLRNRRSALGRRRGDEAIEGVPHHLEGREAATE